VGSSAWHGGARQQQRTRKKRRKKNGDVAQKFCYIAMRYDFASRLLEVVDLALLARVM